MVTDPPYAEVDRSYGRWTEAEWRELMDATIAHIRRVLAPTGSAVFILQATSERVGRMRPWLWRFMADWCERWNMVQDVWWWNTAAMPTVHTRREYGLLRPSVKACVWLGPEDCYRDQDSVFWTQSNAMNAMDRESRAVQRFPSGQSKRWSKMTEVVDERDGCVTPFNLLPLANTNSVTSAGALGHGAGTPTPLAAWWVRYICPPGGVVLDPFAGVGSIGVDRGRCARRGTPLHRHRALGRIRGTGPCSACTGQSARCPALWAVTPEIRQCPLCRGTVGTDVWRS